MTFVPHDSHYFQSLGFVTDFNERMVDEGYHYYLLYYTLRRFDSTFEGVLFPLAVLPDWH